MGQRFFASARHDRDAVIKTIDSAIDLGLPFQVVGDPDDVAVAGSGEVAVAVYWGRDANVGAMEEGQRAAQGT